MPTKLTQSTIEALIQRVINGESVSDVCKDARISRVLFYRWLKRYDILLPQLRGVSLLKEDDISGSIHPRPEQGFLELRYKQKGSVFIQKHRNLTPTERLKIINEVLNEKESIWEIAKKYNISRITIYKWLKRYNNASIDKKNTIFESKIPQIDEYYKQTPDKYEKMALSLVSEHPEWGIRRLFNNVPRIGNIPTVGRHGIQNVLRRNNLSTYQSRLVYAQNEITPLTRLISNTLSFFSRFFTIQYTIRVRIINFFGIAFLSSLVTLATLGIGSIFFSSFSSSSGINIIGLIFATCALFMGSIFFIYSIKYYLSLAVVLSFNQSETVKEQESKSKAMGLKPNLDNIVLTKYPFISIHIPLFNEKNVVERAIKAAANFEYGEPASTRGESTRGRYEVILADDSTDETTDIIDNYLKQFNGSSARLPAGQVKQDQYTLTTAEVSPGVTVKHLHRSTRSGFKGGALSLALQLTDPRAEFISVFDADFVPYPDTLTLFLKYFEASKKSNDHVAAVQPFDSPSTSLGINAQGQHLGNNIAAVQGYQWHVLNKSENWITRGVRSEYAGSYVIERSGEEIYGGLKQISGSVYMIRKDILQSIGWGTSITEDFELTLKLYEKGYKVLYTPYIQAPAECVSTIKRLVRQRMRWAEGHSHNIRKMFFKLLKSPKLTNSEKLEFLYLSPYYLQAFFFIVGTISWFISETIFPARLPFWTSLWGWSLVLTNLIALPLMNGVGLFLEESEEKDYLGLLSFVALSYLVVPFQAYAAVKGLLEKEEGGWFRTPKTGRITDVLNRARFYKWISGIVSGKSLSRGQGQVVDRQSPSLNYLSISTSRIIPRNLKYLKK